MTLGTVWSLVGTAYSVFGRRPPEQDSPVVEIILDALAAVPDEAAPHLVERLMRLDDLPRNLGKFLLEAWDLWQDENGTRPPRQRCSLCGGAGGWECFAPHPDSRCAGRFRHFWARCPSCTPHDPELHLPDRRELEARGVTVMPGDWPGGIVAFRNARGIVL